MKVSELIIELQKCPQDWRVCIVESKPGDKWEREPVM